MSYCGQSAEVEAGVVGEQRREPATVVDEPVDQHQLGTAQEPSLRPGAADPCVAEAVEEVLSDQASTSMGAIITMPFTACANSASRVMSASAWSLVSATYSASSVSGHPSWSAIFHATF